MTAYSSFHNTNGAFSIDPEKLQSSFIFARPFQQLAFINQILDNKRLSTDGSLEVFAPLGSKCSADVPSGYNHITAPELDKFAWVVEGDVELELANAVGLCSLVEHARLYFLVENVLLEMCVGVFEVQIGPVAVVREQFLGD